MTTDTAPQPVADPVAGQIDVPAPDRYAVLGNPVAHSRSPFIHALFAKQTGQSMEYGRLLCPMDGFEAAVRAFADAGGRGCNVTVPFKLQVPALATHCTERAKLAGAANVLCLDAKGWLADNTDGVGLVRDIEHGAGQTLAGQRVLLVGSGGAACGVLGPLLAARPASVAVANRTPDKALDWWPGMPPGQRNTAWPWRRRCCTRPARTLTCSSTPAPAACTAPLRQCPRAPCGPARWWWT
jgi:shikimate dehydrogenase